MEMIAKMTDAEMIVEIITVKMDRIVAAIVEMATRGGDRRDGQNRGNDRRDNNRRDGQNGNRRK